MSVIELDRPATARAAPSPPSPALPPPLDVLAADAPGDALVVTSERRLRRLATVAADTGARFERDRLPDDPVA